MDDDQSTTLKRLNDQIAWYSSRSARAQHKYKLLKITQIVLAALIPLVSVFNIPYPNQVTAVLGMCVLIFEGIQQLNQYHPIWIIYRSTCEGLKHEKYAFLADAGPYSKTEKPLAMLADRIEGLIAQEHAKWTSTQEQAHEQKQASATR